MHTHSQLLTSQQKPLTSGVQSIAPAGGNRLWRKRLQRVAALPTTPTVVPPIVHEVLRSAGQPLDHATRAFMEPRFGHEFSHVRVHTDAQAAESAQAVNALAYTIGHNIVFGRGQYDTRHTLEGRQLLAHELVHVIQQGGSANTQSSVLRLSRRVDAEEKAADAVSQSVMARAYTVGSQIVFAANQYAPHSQVGRRLLAHELKHVVQQSAPTLIQRKADGELRADDESTAKQPMASNAVSSTNDDDETLLTPDPVQPLPNTGRQDAAAPSRGLRRMRLSAVSDGLFSSAVVPADHPSEHEADAVSRAVMQGSRLPAIHLSNMELGRLQRQIYFEDRSALTWADFSGGPDASSPFDAVTWSGMARPAMQPEHQAVDTGKACTVGKKSTSEFKATVAINPAINARALMKPSDSWVKDGKQNDKLLKHEQGHFDISNVLAEKTEAELINWVNANKGSATKCGKVQALNEAIKLWNALDSSTALLAIWDKGEGLRKQAQKDYDDETKHSADAAKQTAWEDEIAKNLPKYRVKAQP